MTELQKTIYNAKPGTEFAIKYKTEARIIFKVMSIRHYEGIDVKCKIIGIYKYLDDGAVYTIRNLVYFDEEKQGEGNSNFKSNTLECLLI